MPRVILKFVAGLTVLAVIALYAHFRYTGLTPHRYVTLGLAALDSDSSPLRQQVAAQARRLLLDSGLVADPVRHYPPDLQMPLPTWRGDGANALRESVRPRYRPGGEPIALTDTNLWLLHPPRTPARDVTVESSSDLAAALAKARPGERIILAPGDYDIASPLSLAPGGTAAEPIQLTASRLGDASLVFRDGGSLQVNGPYWSITDLVIRGECSGSPCPSAIVPDGSSGHLILRNLFVTGVERLLAEAATSPGNPLLAEGISLVNAELGIFSQDADDTPARAIAVRRVSAARDQIITLCATGNTAVDCDTDSLREAAQRVQPDGLILMRRGDYRQAAHFRTEGVHLLAEPGARLLDTATEGKGALVVSASITVEGLECAGIRVDDGNGACLRQNGGDVTLLGVHFHHAQMGVLTGHQGGDVRIHDSYFHSSGADGRGSLGHNIYVNSGQLSFVRSWSLMARNAGHELKSRAAHTRMEDCLVASVNARDSRLVDIPDGGVLEISGCVLGEGPRSENADMIAYGLEIRDGRPRHPENTIRLSGNTLYADRPQGGRLLNAVHADSIEARDNVAVGDLQLDAALASHYRDRAHARVAPYPALPPLVFR